MVGWVITWESIKAHTKAKNNIAALLRWRLSGDIVREIVEALYANKEYTPTEFIRYCVENNGKNNPYTARLAEGRIYFGHDPYLYARIVDNIKVYKTRSNKLMVTWKERPPPIHLREFLKKGKQLS